MRKTNVELITDIMNYSQTGHMMQAFVIEACRMYAKDVIESEGKGWPENYLISYDLWKRCATELTETIDKHYKEA